MRQIMDSISSAKLSTSPGLSNDIHDIEVSVYHFVAEEIRDYCRTMTLIALSISLFLSVES